MEFNPNNHIIKLCLQGMEMEGNGKPGEAGTLFHKAWNEATSDFEKYIAAYYVAKHQKIVSDKLSWFEKALQLALKINDNNVNGAFSSLYLNIAKCYEELNDTGNAEKNYETAKLFADK